MFLGVGDRERETGRQTDTERGREKGCMITLQRRVSLFPHHASRCGTAPPLDYLRHCNQPFFLSLSLLALEKYCGKIQLKKTVKSVMLQKNRKQMMTMIMMIL